MSDSHFIICFCVLFFIYVLWGCLVLFWKIEYLTAGVGHHGKIQNRVWFGGTSPKMADMYTSHKHK